MTLDDLLLGGDDSLDFADLSALADDLADDSAPPADDVDVSDIWSAAEWETGSTSDDAAGYMEGSEVGTSASVSGVEEASAISCEEPVSGILPYTEEDLAVILLPGDGKLAYPGWDGSEDAVYEDGDWDNEITDEDWWDDTGEDWSGDTGEDSEDWVELPDEGGSGDVSEDEGTAIADDDFIIIDWDIEVTGGKDGEVAGTSPDVEIGPAICIMIAPANVDDILV
jgi:hypothetical protein